MNLNAIQTVHLLIILIARIVIILKLNYKQHVEILHALVVYLLVGMKLILMKMMVHKMIRWKNAGLELIDRILMR